MDTKIHISKMTLKTCTTHVVLYARGCLCVCAHVHMCVCCVCEQYKKQYTHMQGKIPSFLVPQTLGFDWWREQILWAHTTVAARTCPSSACRKNNKKHTPEWQL